MRTHAMKAEIGAVFGLNSGWEHALWFAIAGEPREETIGFTRENWWKPVGREALMLRDKAGIIDISNLAKYEVRGPGAEASLDGLFANCMPKEIGRFCLTPLIEQRGGIADDFTMTRLDAEDLFIVGSGMAERFHQRFFKALPLPEGKVFHSSTTAL